jgi:hypothetical protein
MSGSRFWPAAVSLLLSMGCLRAMEYMPVSELKPGMRGITYTVMKGTEIVPLDTEILGVAKNSLGPGFDLIIAKLVDPKTALTGAVHGMSGSPLYINGKLVGALSRRIAFFEKDGHCGFTPIADMLEVNKMENARPVAADPAPFLPMASFAGLLPDNPRQGRAEMLSIPLTVSGLNVEVWQKLCSAFHFAQPGFFTLAGGSGSPTAERMNAADLKPGAPLSAVMLTGSISVAGTGTLTWRDGDNVVAFGHPMFGYGKSNLPMGMAEIITTVASYERPFKMANPGTLIGTIDEDRFSAIAGKIGDVPKMATYHVTRSYNGETRPAMEGSFVSHPLLSPLMMATIIQAALYDQPAIARTFRFKIHGEARFAGHTPLRIDDLYSGQDVDLVFALLRVVGPVQTLYGQRMELLKAESIDLAVESDEGQKVWGIESVTADRHTCKPGDSINLQVRLREALGGLSQKSFTVKLPDNLKSGSFSVRVAGADELGDEILRNGLEHAKDVEDMIRLFNLRRLQNNLYVQLVSKASGQVIGGREMPALPFSVRAVMDSANNSETPDTFSEQIWHETSTELPGMVTGKQEIQLGFK